MATIRLEADHDHFTGKPRFLLEMSCGAGSDAVPVERFIEKFLPALLASVGRGGQIRVVGEISANGKLVPTRSGEVSDREIIDRG